MPRTPREVGKQVHEAVNEQVRDLPIQAARLAMFGVGRALLLADRATRDYKNIRSGEIRPVVDRLKDDAEKITGRIGARVEDLLAETPVGKVLELVGAGKPAPEVVIPVASPPASRPVRASQIAAQATAAHKTEIALGKPASVPAPAAEPVREPVADQAVDQAVEPVADPVADPVAEPVEPVVDQAVEQVADAIAEPADVPVEVDAVNATLNSATLPVPNYEELSHASLRARLRKLTAPEVKQLREYEAAHKSRAEILKMYDNRIAKLSEEV